MTLYLRDEKNETYLDCELWIKRDEDHKYIELSSVIDIKNYSKLLLKSENKEQLINEFDYLSELRGWLWEDFFMSSRNTPERYDEVLDSLKNKLISVGKNHSLHLVTD